MSNNQNTAVPNREELQKQLQDCLGSDIFRLQKRLNRLVSGKSNDSQWQAIATAIEESKRVRQFKLQNIPDIEYPDLPVSEHKDAISDAIANHQVVIIAGETGSGKTTQIPKICLQLGRGVDGLIGHTQPRRLAARTVAGRIAEELGTTVGEKVGFKVRFSDQVGDDTYIKLMTDGILLAEMQADRFLSKYDTLIIDEAHERSLNIDFILGYLKQLLPKRPELKLIITSATIDPERFSKHFNNAPIIQVSGRSYPVEIRYNPLQDNDEDSDQIQGIIQAVDELSREKRGDILVFLSGEREIRDTADALSKQNYKATEILPLYARLSVAEQNRIFQSHGNRRIVLATNVAETSLTVPGIKYVIDPGFARLSRYSYRSKVQRLPIEAISQASANQRAGRCGRVSEGICIRLYSEDDFNGRPEFTDPEILRTNLASVILQMLSLKLGDIQDFPFVQPPDNRFINDGFRLLEELTAVEKRHGKLSLTETGRQIAKLPVDPRYARMVVEAGHNNCVSELIIIAAGLSIQDPRERPQDKRAAADQQHEKYADKQSDFVALLNLWQDFKLQQKELTANQLRKWCRTHFINYLRMREWQDVVSQLKKSIVEVGFRLNKQEADFDDVHKAILSGLLSHIGFKDKEREFEGARGSKFLIFPGSNLSKKPPKWTMVAELVETSRLFGRVAAKIEPEWIEPLAKHLTKYQYSEPVWSKKRGAVQALEKVLLFGLTIVSNRHVNFSQIDPDISREIFIREALVNADTKLSYNFIHYNQSLIEDIQLLEEKSRRRDVLVDEQELVAFYEQTIPKHVCSESGFKKWWNKAESSVQESLKYDPEQLKKHQAEQVNELNFPDSWQQNNLNLKLTYCFEPNQIDDGVSLIIPLPILNQLEENGFDWLIPGFRHELIVTLIKSLPKRLRRNFVPAPNFADACMLDMQSKDNKGHPLPFLTALSKKLLKMTGVNVAEEEWQWQSLPNHLKFNFKVVDGKGNLLKQGRDLHVLKYGLQEKISSTLKQAASPEIEKSGLTQWDFTALEEEYIDNSQGYEVKAYPALVDDKKSVAIKLFESPEKALNMHRQGLRRLIMLNIPSPLSYLKEKLPNKAKLGLYFNPFGQIQALINDCIEAGVDHLITRFESDNNVQIRSPEVFNQARDYVRKDINDVVLDIAKKVEVGLTQAHQVQKKLKGNVALNMISAHGDIKQHLNSLVFPGFITQFGIEKIDDWNRYIKGIVRRLEKLPIDPNKDRLHQLNIEKVQSRFNAALSKIPDGKPVPADLAFVRWMIEELRISFFAQQLGTPMPISMKRIENQLLSF
ncbi:MULTISPECIES: ATP-dependent RNA helicase HrpA [Aliiglaciecola]|uniref:ATP-dependent RNA helicase HrpA n=1 Tax=Aliiglaciecola TaxID=1406885 RepID=UPI001C087DDD|nr:MULTISPECIES: ATP-dependent RNA helicase HrpA [Aliiglaciecola]MBU2876153.1 ATP-dependent RNA helicase HrpA [Aliiglaciecola lipolytica]MDO6712247.1 ATP-dependent RNA helicase HrpA [Aliiglaciecola sp. 2_MG-2023]MDO6753515.1 ATP-dependent RNA helicase HrpA [Aliiglaciecola sp. 1_MG-2023]